MANTDPDHWFLPAERISPHRLPAYTSGNVVTALVDGEAYMRTLSDLMDAMAAEDYFFISGWRVTPTQNLLGEGHPHADFVTTVTGLIASSVYTRALVWLHTLSPGLSFVGHFQENTSFIDSLNAAAPQAPFPEIVAMRDSIVPFIGSHHQKFVVLSSQNRHYGFVGGIDIAKDRWDTAAHDKPRDNPAGRTPEHYDAWHDVHSMVEGPAVVQLWDNFQERWDEVVRRQSSSAVPVPSTNLDLALRPAPEDLSPPAGKHFVQVLRNLAGNGIYDFAPGGEQTIRDALKKAINNAEYYIYIEDQYLWPCPYHAELKAALLRGVKLILVLARAGEGATASTHNFMRTQVLQELFGVNDTGPTIIFPAENLFVFHLRLTDVTQQFQVHSKLMIVDDRYVALGSANFNLRSHTCDSEIELGIVDENTVPRLASGDANDKVGVFPRELRKKLWGEHLMGIVVDDDPRLALLEYPIEALLRFPGVRNVGGIPKPATVVPELTFEPFPAAVGAGRRIRRIAWSPDAMQLGGISAEGDVWVFRLAPPGLRFSRAFTPGVNELQWNPADSGELALACVDGSVRVLDAADGSERLRLESAHEGPVTGVAWSPDGTRLASIGSDRALRVWLRATGAASWQQSIDGDALGLSWSPDGTDLSALFAPLSPPFRVTVALWSATTGTQRLIVDGPRGLPLHSKCLAWAPPAANRRIAISGEIGVSALRPGIVVFDADLPLAPRLEADYVFATTALAWRSTGDVLAGIAADAGTLIWQITPPGRSAALQPIARFAPAPNAPGGDGTATDIAWRPDGLRLATATDTGRVWIWDTERFHEHHVCVHEALFPRMLPPVLPDIMNPNFPVPAD